jgi:hypothetical protein
MESKIAKRPRLLLLSGLMALCCAACASEGSQDPAASEKQRARTQNALYAAGDADSLAAAAQLIGGQNGDSAQRLTLLTRAAALAPDRPDLVWLQIEACSQIESCDPTPLAQTLHALDPENGAAWSRLIDRARKLNDPDAVRQYILATANSKRFDIYWNTSVAHMTNALLKTHTYEPRTALVSVIGVEAALSIPAFQNISNACKAPSLEDGDRLETCRKIAAALRNGDTYITEMIGIAIARRVWPEGSVEYAGAVEERRQAQYRMRTVGKHYTGQLRKNADVLEYLQLLGTRRAEQDVALIVITRAGKSPTPPTDWQESVPAGS